MLCSHLPSSRGRTLQMQAGDGPGICPIPTSLLPTSDDQVLQGGPGIGEVPLLACFPEGGRDPVPVGQDLAVLEGSRHF